MLTRKALICRIVVVVILLCCGIAASCYGSHKLYETGKSLYHAGEYIVDAFDWLNEDLTTVMGSKITLNGTMMKGPRICACRRPG